MFTAMPGAEVFRLTIRLLGRAVAVAVAVALGGPAVSDPVLSTSTFHQIASRCAPAVNVSTLQAVASVESHLKPLTIRDNSSRESFSASTVSAAVSFADDRIRKGHSIDLGLMQINSTNLKAAGLRVEDAFDPCLSVAAASRILLANYNAPSSAAERQAAILITLSRYNTGRPLVGIVNGYANQVVAAEHSQSENDVPVQLVTRKLSSWNIWRGSGANTANWILITDATSEIERAGAQTSDARNEERAPATTSEKGEPYELFAYQESEPNRP